MRPLIFVIYDSVTNSVFAGQVLAPLLSRQQKNPAQPIILVSFERMIPRAIPIPPSITVIYLRRLPFLGLLSLWLSAYQLARLLRTYDSYDLIARSPLAGWVALKALTANRCHSLVIQARGLLAEEYAYAHQASGNVFRAAWHRWRRNELLRIERYVYGNKKAEYCIEAVSPALREYVVTTFHAHVPITIAQDDIPPLIAVQEKAAWRTEIRELLGISPPCTVYCYNGSVKPWQCPELVVSFFQEQAQQDPHRFLLVLTQDVRAFEKLLEGKIAAHQYRVLTVRHADVYRYLAACDVGIIFREPSVVNWVSRPTKVLEYRAAGLSIVHNKTIAYVTFLQQ